MAHVHADTVLAQLLLLPGFNREEKTMAAVKSCITLQQRVLL